MYICMKKVPYSLQGIKRTILEYHKVSFFICILDAQFLWEEIEVIFWRADKESFQKSDGVEKSSFDL